MILPPSAMRRAACWQAKNDPLTFTAKIRSNSSSVTSARGLLNMNPALLTRMSIRPKWAIVSSNSRTTSATWPTSAWTATA